MRSYTLKKAARLTRGSFLTWPRKLPHDQPQHVTACIGVACRYTPHLFPGGGNRSLDLGRQGGRLQGSYRNNVVCPFDVISEKRVPYGSKN
ncbi:hypothetical protein PIB30_065488 [Stylosanthes scabra]|uniref:Uncharacterized protein n=1 Tax=Stylosanthes scabra TaxID=79078 RepID=A0ABU6SMV4_9FABA|nr:hypothetical protein [Stylosanthes scabra]